jgi:SAM-dependent methyltransferase
MLQKIKNRLRGLRQKWGSKQMKQALWDKEFSQGRWDMTLNTSGDLIYDYLKKYCRRGSLLDLGCGSGNTGCELDEGDYRQYVGIDISAVAIQNAKQRAEACGRSGKNFYEQGDIVAYVPKRRYDVILFRESIYYIPFQRIKNVLVRYSEFLEPGGVFIIRWHDPKQGEEILRKVEEGFVVLERSSVSVPGAMVGVFGKRTVPVLEGAKTNTVQPLG